MSLNLHPSRMYIEIWKNIRGNYMAGRLLLPVLELPLSRSVAFGAPCFRNLSEGIERRLVDVEARVGRKSDGEDEVQTPIADRQDHLDLSILIIRIPVNLIIEL